MAATYFINELSSKSLPVAALGLSCGFVQNPLIFKSVFLVTLRDEEAFLSYNLKQCPKERDA